MVSVADWPSPFVTVTSTAPAACAEVLALMVVLLTTVTAVAGVPPIVTVAGATKFTPEMVTAPPPAPGAGASRRMGRVGGATNFTPGMVPAPPPVVAPDAGLTPVTVGAGAT